jgi:MFS family permease
VPSRPNDDLRAAQRRTLRVLVGAQILGGLGTSGAAAGALLALDLTGDETLAGLPLALLVVGSGASVVPISSLSRRTTRRAGLALALGLAAAGALGVVAGAAAGSFALVCAACVPFGAGNTAVMLARYAAADLSRPAERGRAIGAVVFATTFGAVAGPNLLAPTGHLALALGLPELSGLFLLAAVMFLLAALVHLALLRPDPLRLATALDNDNKPLSTARRTPLRTLLAAPAALTGLATVVLANFVMVAVMAMAPVHMHDAGHGLPFIGLVTSIHIAGMFAPAPLIGRLTDRVGAPAVARGAAALLIVAGLLAATAGHSGPVLALGLFALGIGWNAALISGSALLAAAAPVADRPRVEGAGELLMGVAAGTATALAGPVVGVAGYATLAASGATVAALLGLALLALAPRAGGAPDPLPAPRLLS